MAHQHKKFVLATGAISVDVSVQNFITAAFGLSFLLLVLVILIMGIITYLIIQINKNNHVEFMIKQTFIDLFHKLGSMFKLR